MLPGRRQRLPAWIALVAIWALALVPTLSRALDFAAGNGSWAEVCTAQGPRLVSTDAGDDTPPQAVPSLEHCRLCPLALDSAAPLPSAAVQLPLPVAGAEPPPLFLHAPRPLFAWRSAQPRAPPAAA